jgi:hypothetical protein
MSSDIDTQSAKLLNKAPDFGTADPDLFGDLCPADNNGGIVDQ